MLLAVVITLVALNLDRLLFMGRETLTRSDVYRVQKMDDQSSCTDCIEILPESWMRPGSWGRDMAAIVSISDGSGFTRDLVAELGARTSLQGAALKPKIAIHIYAWRRSVSLQRLLASMLAAEYGGRRDICLVFHLDGGNSAAVSKTAHNFHWPFGEKRIFAQQSRRGLKEIMNSSWIPETVDEYAIFLEDDIEVSPLFFEYAEWCARTFLGNPPLRKNLIGCSLYTPRVDEINPTPDPQHPPLWTPPDVIGNSSLFYFQLPCSWGAIYSARQWIRFEKYFRRRANAVKQVEVVPNSRSNKWSQSWKRYLIEYMYLKDLVMLYPSFWNQTSFSTNHYEYGVHSVAEGQELEFVDALRPDADERFTVPLFKRHDAEQVWGRLPATREDAAEQPIPVVSVYHRLRP